MMSVFFILMIVNVEFGPKIENCHYKKKGIEDL